MPVEELKALIPAKWSTQYENLYGKNEAVCTAQPTYIRRTDGSVETTFQKIQSSPTSETFPTVFTMERVVRHQDCDCTCEDCLADSNQVQLDLEHERKYMQKRKSKKSPQKILQDRYEQGDPEVGLLGEPSGKFDYFVLYPKSRPDFDPIFPTPPPDDWGEHPSPPPRHTDQQTPFFLSLPHHILSNVACSH